MNAEKIYSKIIKNVWIYMTRKAWKLGYGRNWMKEVIDNL